jgi:hypothetical protein
MPFEVSLPHRQRRAVEKLAEAIENVGRRTITANLVAYVGGDKNTLLPPW